MEKAIVKAFAGILVGVSIILFILWRLVNYTWDKSSHHFPTHLSKNS